MTATAATEPIEKTIHRSALRLERGDLTQLEVDAIVFYAKETLELGSGFGGAIHARGGETIKKELAALGPVAVGEAVTTTAGRLPAKWIVHACGPKFQEPDMEAKLRRCMLSALRAAEERGAKTIAFPPMGAGFYGVPLERCARAMLEAIREFLAAGGALEAIVVCVADRREYGAFRPLFEGL
ncbi:MAG: macro domain-containing protein [Bryobacteraceae bacterium]|nr:macro domain-containing protein [Bryobacteraceae bacterium]